ncbi:acetyltransferase-like isoleucine patch superfamily enzyme [Sporomusaceae bacterium BoRhaA]|uniref:CatB-related O-acetyltransferase n=1 Tax=Pelorhabdus rhamnosifermentans TaxID=2772457 RepID=UPI001C062D6F|nr:CatB-related O-acetyltransferase [Pelorhabdus rhamnosifermentans]MBU2704021.1 acetyltransferase-like isoleucine patch superfamily enzyme [Pelorhabdus rhamnosifermentans]
MDKLTDSYEITRCDYLFCNLIAKIKGTHKIPKLIKKRSKNEYGEKDNLLRYFICRYHNISIGKYTYGFEQFYDNADGIRSIGSFCSIAENIFLAKSNHPLNIVTTNPIAYLKRFGFCKENKEEFDDHKPVIIGNDVWIGTNVTILPGVKIGNGAVIGAGAIVNKNIPDYAIAVGVPAKVIKYRFSQEYIDKLNKIRWWDWPDDKIRKKIDLFTSPSDFLSNI